MARIFLILAQIGLIEALEDVGMLEMFFGPLNSFLRLASFFLQ
jgi:hypothetical protein